MTFKTCVECRMNEISNIFDPILQRELVSLILTDRDFSHTYFEIVHTNKELKKNNIKVFTSPILNDLITIFYHAFEKNDLIIPSDGVISDMITNMNRNDSDKEQLKKTYKELKSMNVSLSNYHEKKLIDLVKLVSITTFLNDSATAASTTTSPDEILGFERKISKIYEALETVTFTKRDLVDMSDFGEIIKQNASETSSNILIGLPGISKELNGGGDFGGLSRQEVTVLLSGTNDGKSIGAISLMCNALRNGFRIAIYSLEGKRLQAPLRIISNLSGIKYKRLIRFKEFLAKNDVKNLDRYFNPDELKALEEAQKLHDRMTVIHGIKNCEIETIEMALSKEYKKNPFDLLIVDYGQLIESLKAFKRDDQKLVYIFRRLEKFSSNYNCSTLVPMQVNRGGLSSIANDAENGEEFPTYKMSNVAGAYGALKTSGCILTLNRTEQERKEGKVRWSIAKQREGVVGVQLGLVAKFDVSDITRGETYHYENPAEVNYQNTTGFTSSTDISNRGNDIQSLISSNEKLRELSKMSFGQREQKFFDGLKSILGKNAQIKDLEKLKRDLELGNTESEEKDPSEVEGDINSLKEDILDIKEDDDYIQMEKRVLLGSDIHEFKNTLLQINNLMGQIESHSPDLAKFLQVIGLYEKVQNS